MGTTRRTASLGEGESERETLIEDPEERKRVEAQNGLVQFDAAQKLIREIAGSAERFLLRPSCVCEFNRLAIQGIWRSAGVFRSKPIQILNTSHRPPVHENIPRLMEDMCEYVNDQTDASPLHVSAYLMWRINWIHPFVDGNGRTARVMSYIMLCGRLGFELPGVLTVPEQIAGDKVPYYSALDHADRAWAQGRVDVSRMEELLSALLAKQLLTIHNQASS